ncbi:VOC family protein [Hwanghaeella grinnelliae]|uniref:VOC family protein n=1 Tax=Hwanghaeella grinnelliae TaxID=2500179 RepID=A0A437QYT2_9PROT|nr:VOC family protein [Hwanghaeella grinnelliae]RVU39678.1 VOC family protein [Hwanghaeella grinnelliae]
MAKKVASIPRGYRTATPQLVIRGADAAMAWYVEIFGAELLSCLRSDDGLTVIQGELKIGNSIIRVMDEMPAFGILSPLAFGGAPVGLHLYLTKTDEIWERALAAGAGVLFELSDAPWGERFCKFVDPFGHVWSVAHRIAPAPAVPAETEAGTAVAEGLEQTVVSPEAPSGFSVHEPRADMVVPTAEQAMHLRSASEAA